MSAAGLLLTISHAMERQRRSTCRGRVLQLVGKEIGFAREKSGEIPSHVVNNVTDDDGTCHDVDTHEIPNED